MTFSKLLCYVCLKNKMYIFIRLCFCYPYVFATVFHQNIAFCSSIFETFRKMYSLGPYCFVFSFPVYNRNVLYRSMVVSNLFIPHVVYWFSKKKQIKENISFECSWKCILLPNIKPEFALNSKDMLEAWFSEITVQILLDMTLKTSLMTNES